MATFEENQTTLETLGEGIEATESIELAVADDDERTKES